MIKYLSYVLIALIALVFTYISCPIWALWAAALSLKSLPWPFSWVHTHDDDIYGSRTTKEPVPERFFDRFKRACWWIWRNPNYGFNSEVLGLDVTKAVLVEDSGPQKFDTGVTTVRKYTISILGKEYFGYRRDQHLWDKRFIKMWFGWQDHPLTGSDRLMLKLMFNPFRSAK